MYRLALIFSTLALAISALPSKSHADIQFEVGASITAMKRTTLVAESQSWRPTLSFGAKQRSEHNWYLSSTLQLMFPAADEIEPSEMLYNWRIAGFHYRFSRNWEVGGYPIASVYTRERNGLGLGFGVELSYRWSDDWQITAEAATTRTDISTYTADTVGDSKDTFKWGGIGLVYKF